MNLQEKAIEFLTHFCDGNIEELSHLLAEDFHFTGPLVICPSKNEYLESLRENPPVNCQIELVKTFEDSESVGLFYRFTKPNVDTLMAQYFKFSDGKISGSTLIFDSAAL